MTLIEMHEITLKVSRPGVMLAWHSLPNFTWSWILLQTVEDNTVVVYGDSVDTYDDTCIRIMETIAGFEK